MPGTTCFTFHPLANTTIHQACRFPASISKGEAETQMLQGDFPQAPASSRLFAFPSSAQERSSVLSSLKVSTKAELLHLCAGSISSSPRKNSWGSNMRLQQTKKVDNRVKQCKSGIGKACHGHRCLLQRTCSSKRYCVLSGLWITGKGTFLWNDEKPSGLTNSRIHNTIQSPLPPTSITVLF